jgi:hypothetical protein
VLDREGDAAGIQSYVTALNNGASRADVVLVLSESQEHRLSYQATYDLQIRRLGVDGYDPEGTGVGRSPIPDDKGQDAFVLPPLDDQASWSPDASKTDDDLPLVLTDEVEAWAPAESEALNTLWPDQPLSFIGDGITPRFDHHAL